MINRLNIVCFVLLIGFLVARLPAQQDQSSRESKAPETGLMESQRWIGEGKYKPAIEQLRKMAERNPHSADTWRLLGFALHSDGQLDDAIIAHKKTASFEATKGLGHYNLACAYSLKGQKKEAIAHLQQAIDSGFTRIDHIENDSDLDAVRSTKSYEKVIGALKAKMNMEGNKIMNVAIAVWPGIELLDFAGPGEVFAATNTEDGHGFRVFTVGKTTDPILSQGFLTVTPQYALDDCPKVDILVLAGGGTRKVAEDDEFMQLLKHRIEQSQITLSVCNGAYILGKHGYLDDQDATTWHGAIDSMQSAFPDVRFLKNRRYIDNGKIITSAGVSAGIDSSLYLVEKLYGKDTALKTAKYMEYDWKRGVASDTRENKKK